MCFNQWRVRWIKVCTFVQIKTVHPDSGDDWAQESKTIEHLEFSCRAVVLDKTYFFQVILRRTFFLPYSNLSTLAKFSKIYKYICFIQNLFRAIFFFWRFRNLPTLLNFSIILSFFYPDSFSGHFKKTFFCALQNFVNTWKLFKKINKKNFPESFTGNCKNIFLALQKFANTCKFFENFQYFYPKSFSGLFKKIFLALQKFANTYKLFKKIKKIIIVDKFL